MAKSSLQVKGNLKGRLKEEKFHMITESKLCHIESLANRADTFIKAEPKWDKLKNWRSACWAAGSTSILSLFSSICNPFSSINYIIHFSILGISIICGFVFGYLIKQRETIDKNNLHDSYLEEIKKLLTSLREE